MNTQENLAEIKEIDINTDVLVIGGTATGIKAATGIADSGYHVILTDHADSVDIENKWDIEVLAGIRLVGSKGVAGDFTVYLQQNGKKFERQVGAIVVATDFAYQSLNDAYGLAPSESVMTQSDMDAAHDSHFFDKAVVFLAGLTQESTPIALERILKRSLAVQKSGGQAYVFANNLKLAADGLDRLYLETRDAGVICFKFQGPPEMVQDGSRILLKMTDPVLRQEINLAADIVVVEEAVIANVINRDLAAMLRIHMGPQGLLQKDNVHLFPVRSNREGVYVAGSARELTGEALSLMDAENIVVEVTRFLGDGKKKVALDQAVVDRGKCVLCLTCYRCCPHGAIYWDDKAVISPVACQGCGICASECPMDAIQLGTYKDRDMLVTVKEYAGISGPDLNIVAFCCDNSALEAFQMASDFKMKLPAALRSITVPCSGKVDIDFILEALVEGADGVLVLACHDGNCKSINGSRYAGWRVSDAKRKLTEAGFQADRLGFATMASNMGVEFAAIVTDMEEKLKTLGPSPMKKERF